MSSPGSGKTTLLEETIRRLKAKRPIYVIEGDQQTSNDADRIAALEIPVFQVNTGTGCHLEADMVNHAVKHLNPKEGAILFIENVGNLVCPAMFDLGESKKFRRYHALHPRGWRAGRGEINNAGIFKNFD